MTLALCVCCLPLPKNSRFFFNALPLPFFFFHTSVSLLSSFFLPCLHTCCLFLVFPPLPAPFCFTILMLIHNLSPQRSSFSSSSFSPQLQLHSFTLFSYLILSILSYLSDSAPSVLHLSFPLPIFPLDLEYPLVFSYPHPSMFPRSLLLLLTNCLSCLLSSSRMSDFSEEPRFTIEQIDLLQRLRRTGMTKQEILHALDTLDRLDREHGDKFGHRTSSSSSSLSYGAGGANNTSASNATTSLNSTTSASAAATSSASCNGNNSSEGNAADHLAAPAASSTTSKISTATQTQFGSGGLSPSPGNNYDTSPPPGPPPPSAILPSPVSLVALSQNGRDSLAATPNGKLSPPRYPVNSSAAARAFGFEAGEEDLDIDDKVEELMRSVVWRRKRSILGSQL